MRAISSVNRPETHSGPAEHRGDLNSRPPAFSEEAQSQIAAEFPELIAVDDHDALHFACNALPAGGTVVLNSGWRSTVAMSGGTNVKGSSGGPTTMPRTAAARRSRNSVYAGPTTITLLHALHFSPA